MSSIDEVIKPPFFPNQSSSATCKSSTMIPLTSTANWNCFSLPLCFHLFPLSNCVIFEDILSICLLIAANSSSFCLLLTGGDLDLDLSLKRTLLSAPLSVLLSLSVCLCVCVSVCLCVCVSVCLCV